MSNTKDKILQEVRLFFKNVSWKKCLTFLVFLLLSSIFWVMLIYREKFEATYSIPIKYTNIPDSIMFDDNLPSTLNAMIKDDGAALFRYHLTKKNDSLEINIRDLINSKKGSVKLNIQGENMVQLIREKLFTATELVSYSPSFISCSYVVMRKKTVPVIYDGNVEAKDGYIIDGAATIKPDHILIYGGRQTLDTIASIHTVADTIFNLDENLTKSIALKYIKGVKFVPDSVYLNASVDQLNVKEVNVPVTCDNLPKGLSVKFFPAFVKVNFTVGLKKYNETSADKFSVVVDYNDILKLSNSSVSVELVNKPDYVKVQSLDSWKVEFILEKD